MPEERFDGVHDVFERLGWDARTQPEGTNDMEVTTDAQLAESRNYINRLIADGHVTAAELARRSDVKPSAISAFRNDKWKGSAGTLFTTATVLKRAATQLIKQRQADETRIGGFVRTRVAQEIHALVDYAIKRRKIGLFVIPAGCGKTIALEAINEDRPGSVLLTVTGARSSRKAFLQAWARVLGLPETGRAEDLQDAIITRLTGTDRLILIDEAHKLQVASLDAIREVQDKACVPIVLAGTPTLYKSVTSRRVGTFHSEILDQLSSRVGISRDLTELVNSETGDQERLFSTEDIRKVFHRGNVRLAQDAADFLCRLANMPGRGALRTCRDLVQIVVDLYPGQTVTAALLRQALGLKLGTREAGFQIDQFSAEPEEAQAVAAVG